MPEQSKKEFFVCRAELHIHTVLSPCAAVEMIPPLIIQTAQERGIQLISITDHNAIDNIPAVMAAAHGTGVHVLPGIELQTREEIHSICLFDDFNDIAVFFDAIKPSFPDLRNNPDFFGEQFVVDASGDFIRREERLLSASSRLSLKEAWSLVNKFNGLLIPAHVNRKLFGLLPVLGLPPEDIQLSVMEISKHISPHQAVSQYPQLKKYPLIQSGDAHQLDDIRGINQFMMRDFSVQEIQLALTGTGGRSYINISNNPTS